jgi:hypothetical protein
MYFTLLLVYSKRPNGSFLELIGTSINSPDRLPLTISTDMSVPTDPPKVSDYTVTSPLIPAGNVLVHDYLLLAPFETLVRRIR